MAYDEKSAGRVSDIAFGWAGVDERKMFGGVGWLVNGNMCVGVWKEFLTLRVGKGTDEDLKKRRYVRDFDITGNAMRGWVMVEPAGYKKKSDLVAYIELAKTFVDTLPAKVKNG
ncbi:MAG: hypothetical protein ACI9TH_002737 [Kiritimatiellia bacterium]|jgi:hypothetical protein